MNLRKLFSMLILALCLTLLPISAFAASSAISLNPVAPVVHHGGSVTISGTSSLESVIIKVLRPGNAGTVYFDIVPVTNNQFSSSFTFPSAEAAGTYTVVAGQGNQVDTKQLVVTAVPVVTPPIDPPVITPPGGGGTTPPPAGGTTPPPASANIVGVNTSNNVVTSTTGADGRVTVRVSQDATALTAALTTAAGLANQGAAPIVAITFNNAVGEGVQFNLPYDVIAKAAINAPDTIISLQTNDGEYSFPIRVIDLAAIAQSLGTANENIRIQINVSTAGTDMNAKIKADALEIGTSQVGTAIEFTVHATGNGKSIELNNFGNTYVERSIVLAIPSNPEKATVVLYDPATGLFSFVPALFVAQEDGTYKVTFKRNGNSIYTVLSSDKTFSDVSKHWAKADIELLASKQVVKGVTDTSFAPNQDITRAEFAALLVRSLGLTLNASSSTFSDVKASDWFAGAIGAAVEAKLVSGFSDNSFKPNATITREQMAVMVSNAIRATGMKAKSAAQNGALDKFSDKAAISSWAQQAVGQAVQAKIITGMTDKTFVPAANASRAQAVTMLKRLLQHTSFIN